MMDIAIGAEERYQRMAENLRKRAAHLEGYLEANPLETPTAQALFAGQMQLQIVFLRT